MGFERTMGDPSMESDFDGQGDQHEEDHARDERGRLHPQPRHEPHLERSTRDAKKGDRRSNSRRGNDEADVR
jgi:hypothetical protein